MRSITPISCSMRMMVSPSCCCTWRMSSISRAVSSWVMPADGSSNNTSLGRLLNARHTSTPGPADHRAAHLPAAAVDHRDPAGRLEQAIGERRVEDAQELARLDKALLHLAAQRAAAHQVEPEPVRQVPVVADHEVVEDGEREAEARPLEGPRDALAIHALRRQPGDGRPCEGDLSGAGREDAGEHVEEGGLPRPVGTDQAHHRSLFDLQVQRLQCQKAAEAARQPAAGQQRLHHRTCPSRRMGRGRSPAGRKRRMRITIAAKSRNLYSWMTWSFSGKRTTMAVARESPQGLPMPPSSRMETKISDSAKL